MKQYLARNILLLSLVLSSISFILSLIAYYLPKWKHVQLRPTSLRTTNSEENQIDPLIRSEVDKYYDLLYHRGEIHSFGLSTHCVIGGECGQNLLPHFHENDYGICHNVKYHHQCIFSNSLLSLKKCDCQKPSYIIVIRSLLISIIVFHILFIFINLLRLYCHRCQMSSLSDIRFRLIAILSTLFSLLFLVLIIIQQNINLRQEPLEFFQAMYNHYLRTQIYKFSNDLDSIMKQMEQELDINFGASYICIVFVLIFTFICFLISLVVEIKSISKYNEDGKIDEDNSLVIQAPQIQRFIPFEQIQFTRQTRV